MSLITITTENYDAEVLQSRKIVLLDFWATWCGPCMKLVPVVDSIAEERGDITVGKIDVDTQQKLAIQFGIVSIPTLIVMQNGKELARLVGLVSKEKILAQLP